MPFTLVRDFFLSLSQYYSSFLLPFRSSIFFFKYAHFRFLHTKHYLPNRITDTFTKKFGGLIKRRECATVESLREIYEEQFTHPGYQDFLFHSPNNKNITVFGTIDDHDYGCNNGDSTFQYSKESGLAFLNFTNEPINSPIYKRAKKGLGVYGVKVFDFDRPKGSHLVPDEEAAVDPDVKEILVNRSPTYSKKSVAIFVLDVRTNKTPWSSGMDRFKPNKEGDFLGGEQWQWFEKALSHSKATVNIIVQG